MKKISIVLSGILLSSALFTACSKDQGNMAVSPSAAPSASAKGANTLINFRMGGIQASQVTVTSGGRIVSQMGPVNLDFASNAAALRLNPGMYQSLSLSIASNPDPEQKRHLWLIDEVQTEDGRKHMVEFMMTYPMKLRTVPADLLVTDATTVIDLLNIKTEALAVNISNDMLLEADREGDVIRITQDRNPHLYKIILEQLSRMVNISYQNTDPDPWKTPSSLGPAGPRLSPTTDPTMP
jgi:hypothetical protein